MIGISGLGVVGSAIQKSFLEKGIDLVSYDKYKNGGIGKFEDLLSTQILFLALPTVYDEEKNSYDTDPIKETLELLKKADYRGVIIIKSTVEPSTTESLAQKYLLKLIHNPEFLTASTAYEDFRDQKHIVLGATSQCSQSDIKLAKDFYQKYYPQAEISICKSNESESMKIFVNCFYAVKIQFFNELYLTCQNTGTDFNQVRELMIKNGWINPMHTLVPGTDGSLSYGGMCFPKDTNALLSFMKDKKIPHRVLEATVTERNQMRLDHINVKRKN